MGISRRAFLKSLVSIGAGSATGAGAYGYLYEQKALEQTRRSLIVPGLPPPLSGLRIGFMSDIHRSQWVSDVDVSRAVDALMTLQPDLILLGGDYVTWGDRRYIEPAAAALGKLHAPHGVFAVLGNHDDDRDVPAQLHRHGIAVLRDARTRLRIRHEQLELVGIRYWTKRASEIAVAARGAVGPTILLAHDPRRLLEASALNMALVLSGHTHGGQVVLPIVGAVAARKFPVIAGAAALGDTQIFVSRGVGTVYVPIRLSCPPEVALLTLQSDDPA